MQRQIGQQVLHSISTLQTVFLHVQLLRNLTLGMRQGEHWTVYPQAVGLGVLTRKFPLLKHLAH
jgi:hypothetical protein